MDGNKRSPITRKSFLKRARLGAAVLHSTDIMRENRNINWNPDSMQLG